jgi:hypothetical protein
VNRFVLAQEPLPAGQHLVRLQIEPSIDTLAQNNSAGAVVVVSGPPAILIAQGTAGDGKFLADALRAAGLKVDLTTIGSTSLDPQSLRDYASVVLANVTASSLPPGQMRALQAYVRDFGGGLVVVGGDTAYGPGGYARTPLEDMLPVRMDLRGKSVSASVALMLVVDVSGSMGGGPGGASKMDLAKEAAIAAVELLGEYDQVGVLAFDDQDQGRAGRNRLAAQVHAHRQHVLERRAGVTAWPVGVIAAGHDQAAAIVLDVGLQGAQLAGRKLVGGHIDQHDAGVVAQRRQVQRG